VLCLWQARASYPPGMLDTLSSVLLNNMGAGADGGGDGSVLALASTSQPAALGTLTDLRPTTAAASSPTTHIATNLPTLTSLTRAVSPHSTPSPTGGAGATDRRTNSGSPPASPPPSTIAFSLPLPAARPVARRLSAAAAPPSSSEAAEGPPASKRAKKPTTKGAAYFGGSEFDDD
jgi:hypothetical protein